jgi:hypothetical protein
MGKILPAQCKARFGRNCTIHGLSGKEPRPGYLSKAQPGKEALDAMVGSRSSNEIG